MPASSQSTPGVDGDRGGLERLVERREVERDLDDGEGEPIEVHGAGRSYYGTTGSGRPPA